MTPERWSRVAEIYDSALQQSAERRADYVASACGGDAALRREVESLLDQEQTPVLLDRPLAMAAASVLDGATRLRPGSQVGPYRVVDLLGEGGMGQVYRARDTKLQRDVALKILPDAFVHDADRVARFRREAQVLASLNHPNIAAIHGFEDSGEVHALVLELVDGPTLADRLAGGPLPVDEALPIARQIAEALEVAHEHGIVHRDLKPTNIKVRDDGTVKVLDFGLAKAGAAAPSSDALAAAALTHSPTMLSPAVTAAGIIVGTAPYMSPEQAKGRPADKRSDIWAFGCVLYEMLTGTRTFAGDDVAEVVADVIKAEVNWDRLRRVGHAPLETLVRRCLRKDPRQRFGDGGAVRLELEEILSLPTAATPASPVPRRSAFRLALWAATLAVLGVLVALLLTRDTTVAPDPSLRLVVSLPPDAELVDGPSAIVSPDASRIAFVAERGGIPQLHVRDLEAFDIRVLPNTEGAQSPFFSPDGRWVAFFADGKLKKISLTNDTVVPLADARPVLATGAWGDDDAIVFQGPAALARIPAAGGEVERLTVIDQDASPVSGPDVLPGGRAVLVSSRRTGGDTADERSIELLTLATGERRLLVQGGTRPQYLASGHLVFFRRGALMAVPFDLQRLEVTGPPVEALNGVRTRFNGVGAFSCSRNGTCLYVPGDTVNERMLVLVDRGGIARVLPAPPKNYTTPKFSPSGDRVLYWLEQGRCDIELYDVSRNITVRLTSESDNHYPSWSADGTQVAYISGLGISRHGVVQAANAGAQSEPAAGVRGLRADGMLSWSRDGAFAYSDGADVWVVPARGLREPRRFAASRFNEILPVFSRDGRWVAYVSDESGRLDVYVQPFPGPGDKQLVSAGGGTEPVWSHSGRELFFRNGDQVLVAEVRTSPSFGAGRPRVLFTGAYARTRNRISFDVSPDDQTFLMLRSRDGEERPTQINVMVNWFTSLNRLFASS